jgi:tetratricopeptide (TPR) repeat protein
MIALLLLVFGALFTSGQTSAPWEGLTRLANQHHDVDDFAGEEKLRREALRLGEEQLGPDDLTMAPLLSNLALCLHSQGKDAEGDPLVRRAVFLAERSGNKKMFGLMLNSLGVILAGEGESGRAEPVLRRSVAILEEAEGEDAFDVAQAANNLATIYANSREYVKAEKELAHAIGVYEKHLGPTHPLYASVLGNMFVALYEQHRVAEGEPYLRRALAIGAAGFPSRLAMSNLLYCLSALEASHENYKESARLLEKVIAMKEKVLGPQHPELPPVLTSYANVLRRLHQKGPAKQAQNRADFIQKSLLGNVK